MFTLQVIRDPRIVSTEICIHKGSQKPWWVYFRAMTQTGRNRHRKRSTTNSTRSVIIIVIIVAFDDPADRNRWRKQTSSSLGILFVIALLSYVFLQSRSTHDKSSFSASGGIVWRLLRVFFFCSATAIHSQVWRNCGWFSFEPPANEQIATTTAAPCLLITKNNHHSFASCILHIKRSILLTPDLNRFWGESQCSVVKRPIGAKYTAKLDIYLANCQQRCGNIYTLIISKVNCNNGNNDSTDDISPNTEGWCKLWVRLSP